MIGTLTPPQALQVLYVQLLGRLACQAKDKLCVLLLSYVFDGKYIYSRSVDAKKIDILRSHSRVCFQVDVVDNLSSWRSVILWGRYEELITPGDRAKASQLLDDRFGQMPAGDTANAVYFRISIDRITGKFENAGR